MISIKEDLEKGITAQLIFESDQDCGLVLQQLSELFLHDFQWQPKAPEWAEKLSDIYHCYSMDVPVINTALKSIHNHINYAHVPVSEILQLKGNIKDAFPPEFEISSCTTFSLK